MVLNGICRMQGSYSGIGRHRIFSGCLSLTAGHSMSRSNELHPISTAPVQVFYDPFINNHPRVHLLHRYDSATLTYLLITPPPRGVRSLVMRLSLFLREHISGTTCPIFANFCACYLRGDSTVLFWRRCGTLCTSGFMDLLRRVKARMTGDANWRIVKTT